MSKQNRLRAFITLMLPVAIIIIIVVAVVTSGNKENTNETNTSVAPEKVSTILSDVSSSAAETSEFYVYGQYLHISGSFSVSDSENFSKASLIFYDENKATDSYDLICKNNSGSITFTTSEKINAGIKLDDLDTGKRVILIKVEYKDGKTELLTINNTKSSKDITYYTVTKRSKNNKIYIGFSNYNSMTYLEISVEKTELPDNVYDIVIDAGHGGNDSGAIAKDGTYESTITLKYAKALKAKLEKYGYKVKLTIDGTEGDEATAFTMYDKNGRVNIAGDSKAKYNFSIHCNSSEAQNTYNGIEVYTPYNTDTKLAKAIADSCVKNTSIEYSSMPQFRLDDGVYCRTYTQSDYNDSVSSARNSGFSPYNITVDKTTYYYMIRELGGIATGAYIDGRNTKYGKNNYYDSDIGIESYLLETGYLSSDKDLKILKNSSEKYTKAIASAINEYLTN